MTDSTVEASTPASPSAEEAAWSSLVPSEEIREFAATAREQFATLFPSSVLHAMHHDGPRADAWDGVVEQGYTSIGLPEEFGGLGTVADLVAVLEEAGRALVPLPLTVSAAAAQTLLAAGLGHGDLASTRTGLVPRASAAAPGSTVSVFDGALVDEIVTVSPDGEVSRFAVVAERRVEDRAIDPTRATAEVTLGERLASAPPGAPVDDLLAAARVCVAADLVGVGALSLQAGIEHALVREQFGRLIGSFQSIKHLIADTHVGLERARSLVAGAAAAVADGSPNARRLSLLAKAGSAEAALRATNLRTQLLGAMGLTFESDNHLAVRRAQQTAPFLGGAADLYVRAASDGRPS
ncbi:MAG: acyl-CoA dehydrogenase [Protaetiibacter sp.]